MTNVYVANFFFVAAFGLVTIAQWELAIGNGFAYTVFSAFGKSLTRPFSEKLLLDKWKRALLCRLRHSSYTVVWNRTSLWAKYSSVQQRSWILYDL